MILIYRHSRRRGPSKSASDLSNGVIYEDLPSGPAPRPMHATGASIGGMPANTLTDTHTLQPMEVRDAT